MCDWMSEWVNAYDVEILDSFDGGDQCLAADAGYSSREEAFDELFVFPIRVEGGGLAGLLSIVGFNLFHTELKYRAVSSEGLMRR